jgi:hypothetical protein
VQVASHIKEKRAPIEKKLRDFVKICTWDRDLSYWSVKDTVDKAHRALHKQTKEFEVSINNVLCGSGEKNRIAPLPFLQECRKRGLKDQQQLSSPN